MEIGISAVVKQYNLSAAFPGLIPNILSSIQRGATVIMLCRSEERASEAVEWIKEASKDSDGVAGSIRYEQCNLGSVESVKKCAERLNESLDKVCLYQSTFFWYYCSSNILIVLLSVAGHDETFKNQKVAQNT